MKILLTLAMLLPLAGCATYEPYGGDGYRGVVEGRDGNLWYRCRIRGVPAWCRVNE